ncbi:MAG: MarR family transcriptional regulator [Acidobacteriia bacterium]|nr:MarR family transcriptional regulator [Terriglobia bacterium]
MRKAVENAQYRALAEFRYRIRQFLRRSDAAAQEAGLEPQQYQMLLEIRGLAPGQAATIRTLAERLFLRHHSAVELIDRLEAKGFVVRTRSSVDRRQVLVSLLPRGERLLEHVARLRLEELRSFGLTLVEALGALLESSGKVRRVKKRARKRKVSR